MNGPYNISPVIQTDVFAPASPVWPALLGFHLQCNLYADLHFYLWDFKESFINLQIQYMHFFLKSTNRFTLIL